MAGAQTKGFVSVNLVHHHHGRPDSPVHRLSAALKLGVALAIIVTTVLAPIQWRAWFITAAGLLVLAALLSRLPPFFLFRRLLVLSPFVLGVVVVNAFQPTGRANWLGVVLKSVLCLLTVVLVSNTTPFSRILRVLKSIRVPALLITTIALMHRYLFVLMDEAERMRRARASRTFTRRRGFHWRTLATVVGQLFIRASERAERIYDAMCARGWK
jgi:cobalt/nickel transport system permease protein